MGTIIEGDLDRILAVVREMHEAPFAEGAVRVSTLVKIDDRRDKEHSIARKMRSVREKLAAPAPGAAAAPSRPRTRRRTARRARR
jgi:uncharacterized protein YqgV (UPF0045/DUF77 family)